MKGPVAAAGAGAAACAKTRRGAAATAAIPVAANIKWRRDMDDIDFSLPVSELNECVDGRRGPLRGKLRAAVGSGFVFLPSCACDVITQILRSCQCNSGGQ